MMCHYTHRCYFFFKYAVMDMALQTYSTHGSMVPKKGTILSMTCLRIHIAKSLIKSGY